MNPLMFLRDWHRRLYLPLRRPSNRSLSQNPKCHSLHKGGNWFGELCREPLPGLRHRRHQFLIYRQSKPQNLLRKSRLHRSLRLLEE